MWDDNFYEKDGYFSGKERPGKELLELIEEMFLELVEIIREQTKHS